MTWPSMRLSDLCKVITKGTTPTTLGYNFCDKGVGFLRVQNIGNGRVNYERDTLFIDERTHETLKRSQVQPGDVLVSIAGTIGRAGVVPENAPALNCNQAVAIVRANGSVFRPFLRHWLESSDAQRQMLGAMVTGTISNLSLTQVGNLQIPLPPLTEQRRIAAIMDKAQAVQAKRRAALAQLDALPQAIFLDVFGDHTTILGRWPTKNLGEILEFLTSGSRGWAAHYADSGNLFLRIQNVRYDELLLDDIAYVNPPDTAEAKRTRVQPGDVLLSITADLGRTAVVPEGIGTAFINQHLSILRTKAIAPRFLSAFIASPVGQRQVSGRNRQAVKAGLNFDDIRSFVVPLPPTKLQGDFVRRVAGVEKLSTVHRASLAEMDALRASLQEGAFRGQL
jgi:type I restriction enzyme S subunit